MLRLGVNLLKEGAAAFHAPSLQFSSHTAALQSTLDFVTTLQLEGHLSFTAIKVFAGTKAV